MRYARLWPHNGWFGIGFLRPFFLVRVILWRNCRRASYQVRLRSELANRRGLRNHLRFLSVKSFGLPTEALRGDFGSVNRHCRAAKSLTRGRHSLNVISNVDRSIVDELQRNKIAVMRN